MTSTSAKALVVVLASSLAVVTHAQQKPSPEPVTESPAHQAAQLQTSQYLFGSLAVSSKSTEARHEVETAFERYENFQEAEAIQHAKNATQKDANFVLAYAIWSYAARTAGGAPEPTRKAKDLAASSKCTSDEKLLVKFMTGSQDSDLLPAITAMNDLLNRHPKDKHILYISGEWLYSQQNYARGLQLMNASLQQDPSFPPALNMLGYAYVWSDPQPAKAIAYLRQYAEILPGDPNPQDSLGEVLRMTGDDSGSLTRYAAALQISPNFLTSQYGRGDTFTLMGRYADARREYDKALAIAPSDYDRLHIELQKALVHFWEGNLDAGRKELAELSQKAAESKSWVAAFEIDYARALLAADANASSHLLATIEQQLANPPDGLFPATRNREYAHVLRQEVRLAALNHNIAQADTFLQKLQSLAESTRDPLMESVYESSRGYLDGAKGDYANAADELTSDLHSPLVAEQLILVEQKLNDQAGLQKAQLRLKYLRTPTAEWFVVTHKPGDNSQTATN